MLELNTASRTEFQNSLERPWKEGRRNIQYYGQKPLFHHARLQCQVYTLKVDHPFLSSPVHNTDVYLFITPKAVSHQLNDLPAHGIASCIFHRLHLMNNGNFQEWFWFQIKDKIFYGAVYISTLPWYIICRQHSRSQWSHCCSFFSCLPGRLLTTIHYF